MIVPGQEGATLAGLSPQERSSISPVGSRKKNTIDTGTISTSAIISSYRLVIHHGA